MVLRPLGRSGAPLSRGGAKPAAEALMATSRLILLLAAATLVAACGDAARVPPIPLSSGSLALDACTRCHGLSENGNAAPPLSLLGETATTDIGVGAHQSHLRDNAIRQALACAECHVVPARVDEPGHIEGAHAKLTFGDLAQKRSAKPVFDRATASCSTVYCHGATLGAGGT